MLKNEITNRRVSAVLVIVFAALVLIAIVIWVFDKKIRGLENKAESGASTVQGR